MSFSTPYPVRGAMGATMLDLYRAQQSASDHEGRIEDGTLPPDTRTPPPATLHKAAVRLAQAHRHPLLLLLDEFAVLGKLDFFGRAMAYLRGYSIRVYLSIQSLAQLHDIYGPHQSITANCPLQVAFAPADLETAELR